jgi:hypothetical protein
MGIMQAAQRRDTCVASATRSSSPANYSSSSSNSSNTQGMMAELDWLDECHGERACYCFEVLLHFCKQKHGFPAIQQVCFCCNQKEALTHDKFQKMMI